MAEPGVGKRLAEWGLSWLVRVDSSEAVSRQGAQPIYAMYYDQHHAIMSI